MIIAKWVMFAMVGIAIAIPVLCFIGIVVTTLFFDGDEEKHDD